MYSAALYQSGKFTSNRLSPHQLTLTLANVPVVPATRLSLRVQYHRSYLRRSPARQVFQDWAAAAVGGFNENGNLLSHTVCWRLVQSHHAETAYAQLSIQPEDI
jgi:hypothetical protein